jgi:hypothetical protein
MAVFWTRFIRLISTLAAKGMSNVFQLYPGASSCFEMEHNLRFRYRYYPYFEFPLVQDFTVFIKQPCPLNLLCSIVAALRTGVRS